MVFGLFPPLMFLPLTPKFRKKSETVLASCKYADFQRVGGFTSEVSESETAPIRLGDAINDGFTSKFLKPDVKL